MTADVTRRPASLVPEAHWSPRPVDSSRARLPVVTVTARMWGNSVRIKPS